MKNTMIVDGCKAVVTYDSEIDMFRGEFVGLNGGADFYAKDSASLKQEGATSLRVFLEMCAEEGVTPFKSMRDPTPPPKTHPRSNHETTHPDIGCPAK